MTNEAFVKIIAAIITIVITLITTFVIPAIKNHMSQQDMDLLINYITIAIRCADQIFTVDQWKEKKAYVKAYIIEVIDQKLHIKLTDQDIETLIEGLVNEIHNNGTREADNNNDIGFTA